MKIIEIVLLVLLILLVLVIVSYFIYTYRQNKEKKQKENTQDNQDNTKQLLISQSIDNITKQLNNSQINQTEELLKFKDSISENILNQITNINKQIDQKLQETIIQNKNQSQTIIQNITTLTEKSNLLRDYSKSIDELKHILSNQKLRGLFGEFQLEQIFDALSNQNKILYERQAKLSNGKIVDLLLKAPNPLGNIAIDSKFPLENYQILSETPTNNINYGNYRKVFINDVKAHIDKISQNYVIVDDTYKYAIMFIPAESIFTYIVVNCPDLLKYGLNKNIWICSPTTLISTLSTINAFVVDIQKTNFAKDIAKALDLLAVEFKRFDDRFSKVINDSEKLLKDITDYKITQEKISKQFTNIKNIEFKNINEE